MNLDSCSFKKQTKIENFLFFLKKKKSKTIEQTNSQQAFCGAFVAVNEISKSASKELSFESGWLNSLTTTSSRSNPQEPISRAIVPICFLKKEKIQKNVKVN